MDLETAREISKLEQVVTEDKYDRRQVRNHIREYIGYEDPVYKDLLFRVQNFCINNHIQHSPDDLTTELMLTALIVNRAPIQSIVANLALNMEIENEYLESVEDFTKLILGVSGVIYDIEVTRNDAYVIIPRFKLPATLEQYISIKKYLPPLTTVPKKWFKNEGGGYLTRKESVVLGKFNHHSEKQSIDAINILQEIPLELDLEALSYEETPNKPLDTPEKVQQFNQLAEESLNVYGEVLDRGNEFYFTWKFDKRGRMYSSGYHINIQATKYKKAAISFKRKELIK